MGYKIIGFLVVAFAAVVACQMIPSVLQGRATPEEFQTRFTQEMSQVVPRTGGGGARQPVPYGSVPQQPDLPGQLGTAPRPATAPETGGTIG